MRSDVLARIKELDGAHPSLVVASVDAEGAPHATHTFFAWEFDADGPSLLVTVLSHSAKMRNIRHDRRVAFTIGGELPDLWLNGHGTAVVLQGSEAEQALDRLIAKTGAVRSFTDRLPTDLVRLHVRDLRITDVRERGRPARQFAYPSEREAPEREV